MESLSLSELFNRGQGVYLGLKDSKLASADPQFQSQVEEGITFLERASDLVQRLGIFSENEILEDINVNDLRFLLVNAYLGGLVLQRTGGNRKEILDLAKVGRRQKRDINNHLFDLDIETSSSPRMLILFAHYL
jgi:immunoglobulin-binding protein 1